MSNTVDLTFLQGFTGGNQDKMKKYIQLFLQLCPKSLAEMHKHIEQQDYDALRATAHAIKPQITYMGIKSGEPLVKAIEQYAGAKTELEKLPQMVNDFDTACRAAMKELEAAIA